MMKMETTKGGERYVVKMVRQKAFYNGTKNL